jgi:hypothetical protein
MIAKRLHLSRKEPRLRFSALAWEYVQTGIIDRHFRTEALSGFRPDGLAH